jgi:hypothetical protein
MMFHGLKGKAMVGYVHLKIKVCMILELIISCWKVLKNGIDIKFCSYFLLMQLMKFWKYHLLTWWKRMGRYGKKRVMVNILSESDIHYWCGSKEKETTGLPLLTGIVCGKLEHRQELSTYFGEFVGIAFRQELVSINTMFDARLFVSFAKARKRMYDMFYLIA